MSAGAHDFDIVPVSWAPCVCGGVIFTEGDCDTVERAVDRHNMSVRHLLWRIARLEREATE